MKHLYLFVKKFIKNYREKDIAGFDVNMGCPREFSVKVIK